MGKERGFLTYAEINDQLPENIIDPEAIEGIIATFNLMTVFGSGDIKMLSSGISEALITTEYGLYVAIPCVLMHSFLSRKAKGIADKMEQVAVKFMSEVGKV